MIPFELTKLVFCFASQPKIAALKAAIATLKARHIDTLSISESFTSIEWLKTQQFSV